MHDGGTSLPNYRETWKIRMIKSQCARKACVYTPYQRSHYPHGNDAASPCKIEVILVRRIRESSPH